MMTGGGNALKVGIAGLGAIGSEIAGRLDAGVPGLQLVGVAAGDRRKAEARLRELAAPAPVLTLETLAEEAAAVVECAPAAVFAAIAEPVLRAGRILLPLSIGALLSHPELIDLAESHGGRIVVPTGALLGLDAVRAAALGKIDAARIITRKPPRGLAGAPYLAEHGISLEGLDAPLRVFEGSARDGARGFPANVNVAAALSLAGIGPDQTRLEIWADPELDRNVHTVLIEADSARLTMTIENVPSATNPRTGRITALSAIAALRGLIAPLTVGS